MGTPMRKFRKLSDVVPTVPVSRPIHPTYHPTPFFGLRQSGTMLLSSTTTTASKLVDPKDEPQAKLPAIAKDTNSSGLTMTETTYDVLGRYQHASAAKRQVPGNHQKASDHGGGGRHRQRSSTTTMMTTLHPSLPSPLPKQQQKNDNLLPPRPRAADTTSRRGGTQREHAAAVLAAGRRQQVRVPPPPLLDLSSTDRGSGAPPPPLPLGPAGWGAGAGQQFTFDGDYFAGLDEMTATITAVADPNNSCDNILEPMLRALETFDVPMPGREVRTVEAASTSSSSTTTVAERPITTATPPTASGWKDATRDPNLSEASSEPLHSTMIGGRQESHQQKPQQESQQQESQRQESQRQDAEWPADDVSSMPEPVLLPPPPARRQPNHEADWLRYLYDKSSTLAPDKVGSGGGGGGVPAAAAAAPNVTATTATTTAKTTTTTNSHGIEGNNMDVDVDGVPPSPRPAANPCYQVTTAEELFVGLARFLSTVDPAAFVQFQQQVTSGHWTFLPSSERGRPQRSPAPSRGTTPGRNDRALPDPYKDSDAS